MIAVGLCMLVICAALIGFFGLAPAGRYDWRDFLIFPFFAIGVLLMLAGLIRWLWLVAP